MPLNASTARLKNVFPVDMGSHPWKVHRCLLRGLWLKELLLNGHQHLAQTSEVTSITMSRICQEHLDPGKILHFFHDDEVSQVEKLA